MSVKAIASELTEIYNSGRNIYIMTLYRKLSCYNRAVNTYIKDTEVIDNWNIEMVNIRTEAIFGDNDEYTDLNVIDCLVVVKKIIDILESMPEETDS